MTTLTTLKYKLIEFNGFNQLVSNELMTIENSLISDPQGFNLAKRGHIVEKALIDVKRLREFTSQVFLLVNENFQNLFSDYINLLSEMFNYTNRILNIIQAILTSLRAVKMVLGLKNALNAQFTAGNISELTPNLKKSRDFLKIVFDETNNTNSVLRKAKSDGT